ncbi:peptidoglycan-binding domain-containing protein [Puniceibacterium sp. IMCC21224]|uniref:peptidoglycan-binding domain-containing protein n=1 Tax=Puniceibacterium sp. IMCC21224 TaxID=1618204 RepID=UPI001E5911D4|nr:peptidoglycan-binding domain-containing protein [Puniceibacterium sp. IMCC21224]
MIAAAIALAPVPALANDALIGGLVGGIIGGAIANQPRQRTTQKVYRKSTTTKKKAVSSVSSATRNANRESQTALNYFGFNSGTPDGVLGSRSRSAISAYQAHLGYTPTGQLTQYERDFLISAYYRAQSGEPATSQLIASNPQGVRGLLTVYRDEQLNGSGNSATSAIGGHYGLPSIVAQAVHEIAKSSDPSAEQLVQRSGFIQLSDINGDGQTDYILDTSVTGSAFWCNAQTCSVRVFASTPDGYERNDFQAFNVTPAMFTCQRGHCAKTGSPETQMVAAPMLPTPAPQTQLVATPVPTAQPVVKSAPQVVAAALALPDFFGGAQAAAPSLASHCNKVNLLTSTNGGFTTEATLSDPDLALAEQMCLARTYAISAGEDLMAKVQGATTTQIVEQCKSFGPLLKDHVAAVSLQSRDEVLRGVAGFVLASGMSPTQLEATARICLSAGYKLDDMQVAMGSALLLVSLGKAPYSEILGHHLSQGYGAAQRDDLALVWYKDALDALQSGVTPVFAPGQPERSGLIRKASMMLGGNASAVVLAPVPASASLPVFTVSE